MSDTPKTDAAQFQIVGEGQYSDYVVWVEFAREQELRITELERENIEQARLLGMSAERELALRAKLEAEVEEWKVEYWREKAISTKLEEQNLKLLQDSLERDVLVDRLAEPPEGSLSKERVALLRKCEAMLDELTDDHGCTHEQALVLANLGEWIALLPRGAPTKESAP